MRKKMAVPNSGAIWPKLTFYFRKERLEASVIFLFYKNNCQLNKGGAHNKKPEHIFF